MLKLKVTGLVAVPEDISPLVQKAYSVLNVAREAEKFNLGGMCALLTSQPSAGLLAHPLRPKTDLHCHVSTSYFAEIHENYYGSLLFKESDEI